MPNLPVGTRKTAYPRDVPICALVPVSTYDKMNGSLGLKDDIEGKSVSVSLVLLTNASRMEELRNLWNDARVVTAGIWRVPPSNRESRSLKRPKNT